ncbi:MAG: DNA methyltransferase [Lachnospirales bacterium]
MNNMINMITTKKAAEILGVSTSTIYRMVEKSILTPSKTPGGQRRFSIEQLLEFKEKSKQIDAPQNPSRFDDVQSSKVIKKIKKEKKSVYDHRNKLNDLTGSEWLPSTKSYFYQKGLGAKHPHAQIERQHPAPYSFQDIQHLITFFTKRNQSVLDPFGGIGSTAKACALEGRICTSIELSSKWCNLAIERLEYEVGGGISQNHSFINGDSVEELIKLENDTYDFMVTSPPYWSILNKKADHKVTKERVNNNLATNYSDGDEKDLANINDYETFLDILTKKVFLECGRVLKPKAYMCLIVSDFRNKSEYISFHSDLIQKLNKAKLPNGYSFQLQGTKILLQNHKSLLPYGYPFAYVENIHHQYVLIFRKEVQEKVKK